MLCDLDKIAAILDFTNKAIMNFLLLFRKLIINLLLDPCTNGGHLGFQCLLKNCLADAFP